jgi:hypothetical protein
MTDEPQDTVTDEPEETAEGEPEGTAEEEWTPPSKEDFEKLQRTAAARKKERDAYAKRLREATAGKEDKPDPMVEVNARIVGERARTELAKVGITDDDDQDTVLDVLDLSGVEVDERGRPDRDAIATMVDELRRVFRESAPVNGRRRAPAVDTRDKGGAGASSRSRDEERYRRIIGRR